MTLWMPSRMGGVNSADVLSDLTATGIVPIAGNAAAAAGAGAGAPGAAGAGGVGAPGDGAPGAGAAGAGAGAGGAACPRASGAMTRARIRTGTAGMNVQRDSAPAGLRIIRVFL